MIFVFMETMRILTPTNDFETIMHHAVSFSNVSFRACWSAVHFMLARLGKTPTTRKIPEFHLLYIYIYIYIFELST
jgi:hypothetical protein